VIFSNAFDSSRGGSMSHRWSQRLSFKLGESLRRVGSFRSIGHDPEADSCLGVEYEASSELASMAYPAAPSMWRLMKLNSPEWPYALLGSLGAIMAGCETPLFALAISHMLVTFYNPNASFVHHEVARICFIFAAATVVTVGIYVLQHFFFGLTGECLTMRIRELMFQCKELFLSKIM